MQEASNTVLDAEQMKQLNTKASWEYSTKEERQAVKVRILKISPVARSPRAKEILHKIEQEEKVEDRQAALTHTLTERADSWGRKKLTALTRETTDKVGRFSATKGKLRNEAITAHARLVESARAKVKKAVQQLQEQLVAETRALDSDKDAALARIEVEFQPQYAEAEKALKEAKVSITDIVGEFTSHIQGMPLYDLERIADGKAVRISEPGGALSVEVVCPDAEGP